MYYIYFPYVTLLAALMLYDCYQLKQPRWWALAVLLAPVTTPYFIFKSRKESGVKFFMFFIVTFCAVTGGELFLYSKGVNRHHYAHQMPEIRQMIHLSDQLKTTTMKLDHELGILENLTKIESRAHEIKSTFEFVEHVINLLKINQEAIKQMVTYSSDHETFFIGRNLEWVLTLRNFYTNRNVIQHYKSLQNYLDRFADVLKYTYVNFYNITEYKSLEHLKNYDEYYLRYRRAIDSHNRFNTKRIDFQNVFADTYPDLKSFLPGERQTDTFRLWE
ncbi:hypothetical protein [Desulfobacula sp.]|uniref:hypothetical protein n=1 Tax=Desulfobacula sp. TaxID=2593537 RepID=UPI0026318ABE|nr:hypothetical protein [Desulfobacula sp.]